jgi:hypothetical protein
MNIDVVIHAGGINSEEAQGDPSKIIVSSVFSIPSTSASIDTQLPEFVRQDHPKFVTFLKSYYDWLEIKDNTSHNIKRITQYADIDSAIDQFDEALHKQFLVNMPRTLAAEKPQILKNIKQFYRAKGTEKSFKFFFRALYDSPTEFYYPRQDILRLSDGKYIRQRSVRVSLLTGSSDLLKGTRIVGQTSKISAYVDRCMTIPTIYGTYYELFLNISSITGTFSANEILECRDSNQNVLATAKLLPVLSSVEIVNNPDTDRPQSGAGYKLNDTFYAETQKGRLGTIRVSSIDSSGSIKKVAISDFGVNYPRSSFDIALEYPIAHKDVKLSLSSNVYDFSFEKQSQTGDSIFTISNIKNDDDKSNIEKHLISNSTINITSEVGSHRFLITKVLNLLQSRIILFIKPINSSQIPDNFDADIRSIESVVGSGAVVRVSTSVFCDYQGYYISNNGQLSETKYLHDGEFYQQFSYVVYNRESTDTYRTYLKDLIHPLGLKFYGGFRDAQKITQKVDTVRNSPVVRKFQQHPRKSLFHNIPVPDFRLIKNGIIQIENKDYTVLPKGAESPYNPLYFSVRLFGIKPTSTDTYHIIFRNGPGTILVKELNTPQNESVVVLPFDIPLRRYESQILPYAIDLKAPALGKPKTTDKCPALDGIKAVRNTQTVRISNVFLDDAKQLGASRRSIYRDRFRYLPTENMLNTKDGFVEALNQIEQDRADKYSDYSPTFVTYTPTYDASLDQTPGSWLDSFVDGDQSIPTTYNTFHPDSEKTRNLDNAKYWNDPNNQLKQIANTQIRHFKYVIPKSLELGDVPDMLIVKNGIILRDNYDYLIIGKNNNPWSRSHYCIKLLDEQTLPINTDKYEVIFRHANSKRILTKTLLHSSDVGDDNRAIIEIPHSVSIQSPNNRINIMPDVIVSRGIGIE